MTREEAIEYFKMKVSAREAIGNDIGTDYEAYKIALTALRPVSREQAWRGEWLHDPETGYEHCDKCSHTISLDDYLNRKPPLFCEMCGRPLTDEAVDMVMERWKELKDGTDD